MRLNRRASVVEMRAARSILAELGLKARRGDDYLHIFKAIDSDSYSLYTDQDESKEATKLYVDEGSFSYCLQMNGKCSLSTDFDEYVDYRELLGIIARKWFPSSEMPVSEAMGRGRRQEQLIHQYHLIIENDDRIEWIVNADQ